MEQQTDRWVIVLATGDPFLIAIAKSLLYAADIPYITRGEILQDVIGAGRLGTGFSPIIGPVELLVPGDRAEEALLIFSDLEEYPSLKND